MYTLILDQGTVTRDSDGKVIAPCQSAEGPDFVEYIQWIEAGGEPTVYDTDPNAV